MTMRVSPFGSFRMVASALVLTLTGAALGCDVQASGKDSHPAYEDDASAQGSGPLPDEDGSAGTSGSDPTEPGGSGNDGPSDASIDPPTDKPDTLAGTNLAEVRDYGTNAPFTDLFRASRPWKSGTASEFDDGKPLDLDEHGWVRSLAPGQVARAVVLNDEGGTGCFKPGRYLLTYEGTGKFSYRNAAVVAAEPGREVLDVDLSGGGLFVLELVETDPSDPVRNVRVVPEELADAPPTFSPAYVKSLQNYSVLRFMDWNHTNHSEQRDWADRPQVSDASWFDGVPYEVMIELANLTKTQPWITVPHQATDEYVRELARLLRDEVDPQLEIWIEHSNEVWNTLFEQSHYAAQMGAQLLPGETENLQRTSWHALRSKQIFEIFEEEFGGTERLVRVMGSQSSNPWVSEQALSFENAGEYTDVLAIAPYFGGKLGREGTYERVRGMSPGDLLRELEQTSIPEALEQVDSAAEIADRFGVGLVAYEGGQHLAGVGGAASNDSALNALFDAVNEDPGMKAVYEKYLRGWDEAGGEMFVHFQHIARPGKYGRWGSKTCVDDPPEKAPKYEALQEFAVSR